MTKIPETTMNGDKMLLFIDQLIDLANFMKATEERWLGRGKIVNVFSEMLVSGNSDQQLPLLLRADQNDGKSDQIVNLTNLTTSTHTITPLTLSSGFNNQTSIYLSSLISQLLQLTSTFIAHFIEGHRDWVRHGSETWFGVF